MASRLSSREAFRCQMCKLLTKEGFAREQTDELLQTLYDLARQKCSNEEVASETRDSASHVRQELSRLHAMRVVVARIVSDLQQLSSQYGRELRKERAVLALQRYFKKVLKQIAEREQVCSAQIHPTLRTPKEKARAKQFFGSELWRGGIEPKQSYPNIRPKTRAVDRWLIGEAAASLKAYGLGVAKSSRVIAGLFEFAFGAYKLEESIAKEIRRQRINGTPIYGWKLRIVNPPYGDTKLY